VRVEARASSWSTRATATPRSACSAWWATTARPARRVRATDRERRLSNGDAEHARAILEAGLAAKTYLEELA
jgi:hypothetical protein